MKHKYYLIFGIIIALAIVGIILIINYSKISPGREIGPGTEVIPCNWVYKTNGDYFNLIRANIGYDGKGNEIIIRISRGMNKTKLENGYIHEIDGCSKTLELIKPTNVAFLSKTVQEWNQEDVACKDEVQNKLNQLRIQKCGSLNFDIFEERREGAPSRPTVPPKGVQNPTKCTYDITQEESNEISSCEGHKYSIDMVIDRNPFTELYFCDEKFNIGDINGFIKNNQLNVNCEKLIP